MCGIIAIVRRRSDRVVPAAAEVVGLVEPAARTLAGLAPVGTASAASW